MKRLFFALLFFTTAIGLGQEKLPTKYIVQVTYDSGIKEVIPVKNSRKEIGIAQPIVDKGSIFYDGEYMLLNVKSIKILKTEYTSIKKKKETSDYLITRVNYYDPLSGKNRIINVITDPAAERAQREVEVEAKKHPIFARSTDSSIESEKLKELSPKKYDPVSTQGNASLGKDSNIISRRQGVYESDGNGNFNRIENSGLVLIGNRVENQTDGNFKKKSIPKDSPEHEELLTLNLKKGIFIIEKSYNSENVVIGRRILPVNISSESE